MSIDVVKPEAKLAYPFPEAPSSGRLIEVRPGLLWLRLPLPFKLDHVNIYLIQDGDGWVIVDTGISTNEARAVWDSYFAGALAGLKITKVLVTHFHPDHIGLAGWLCDRFQARLLTSLSSYMSCRVISLDPLAFESPRNGLFYRSHGMDDEAAQTVSTQGHEYLRQVDPLPDTFLRLVTGDALMLGDRTFRVVTGDGHVAEQVMLYCEAEKILLAADQVLEHISPNVSVWAGEPDGDPLGHYLRSLRLLISDIPDDVLVLPGHMRPFYGLHTRAQELIAHHELRCGIILDACRDADRSVAELVPLLFQRALNPHQMGFAFAETLAHANRLVRRGELDVLSRQERFLFRLARPRAQPNA
ncbi:MBL fold metallo-hydrolase [Bradyrhizobium tropiciagri]|uniref:MBL fold metallo-hydrolase n=1 Tax=Bradyrhizobium tropiciagri TaxID=312253 RepID=UPI001BA9B3C9|nr:MBL fold metallo-hydrolase [Bradyrhizobium tropiciagri]MBR0899147.1 MBL fold metallo-hydrolase [Bradyrhizobium tropiciagri]